MREWPMCVVFRYPPLKRGTFIIVILLLLQHYEQTYGRYSSALGCKTMRGSIRPEKEDLVLELFETLKCPCFGRW